MNDRVNQSKLSQPIDKLAVALIILLALIMGLLIWGGNACQDNCLFHAGAKVSNFSWSNKTIGGRDRAFILTFNRPMDRDSVAENLTITPSLPGKISWSGLRMAYTLDYPIPYGESYQVTLKGAKERFPNQKQTGGILQPFDGQFSSRDRALAYVGTEGEEAGRLIVSNWTRSQKIILTPPNLAVFDFKPYPEGDRLLFSAADKDLGIESIRYLQLYSVSTRLDEAERKVKLILDNQTYQNNKFDISLDGKTIVVQRLNRENPKDYGLWKIVEGKSPQIFTNNQVGDFLIAPDSQAVAVAQGEGIALLPLKSYGEPLDFLSKFGRVLDFTADGTGAAMVNYNTDSEKLKFTRSLYYVNSQGIEKELLNTDGSIQNCQFNPVAEYLYCWLTELVKGKKYIEKPYLAEINLKTGKKKTIITLPKYQESQISIASDGLGILFEGKEAIAHELSLNKIYSGTLGEKKNTIWLAISTQDSKNQPIFELEKLPMIGFHPQWLP